MGSNGDIVTAIKEVPVTQEYQVPKDLPIKQAGLPRANITVDAEHPTGTYKPPKMTVLQQHISFWDSNNDGVITLGECYDGWRRIGFNPILALLGMLVINLNFSYFSAPNTGWKSWIPDPFFRVYMDNIHRCKHGSDSETYDTEGRFVPQKYEEIFSKYDKDNKGGLYFKEVLTMVYHNRNVMDFYGWIAGSLEWLVTWFLVAREVSPHGKMIAKDDVRGVYDGTLFYKLADELEKNKIKKPQFKAGIEAMTRKEE